MDAEGKCAVSIAHTQRDGIKSSIKHLDGRVAELEAKRKLTAEDRLFAQHLVQKLKSLQPVFTACKSYHLALVDCLNEEAKEGEQLIVDEIDDKVVCLGVCLQ